MDALKIGIGAAAAYLLYEWYLGQAAPATSPGTTVVPSGSGTATVSPTSGTTAGAGTPVSDAKAKVATAMATSGFVQGNVDQLGYYYAQATGKAAPFPESYGGGDRSVTYTLDQWWAKVLAGGTALTFPTGTTGFGAGIWGYGRGYVRQAN